MWWRRGRGDGGWVIDQMITINWGTEPSSLDPGLATDTTTSSDVISNIMDPLVELEWSWKRTFSPDLAADVVAT